MRIPLRIAAGFGFAGWFFGPQQSVPRVITPKPIEAGRWSLVLERTIQPDEGDKGEIIDAGDLAITEDGFVAVAESKPAHVKIFSPNGSFVRSIGRDGSGPGEFRSAYIALRGDTLVVQDPRQSRAVMINWRTGAAIGGLLTARNYFYPIGIDANGRAVARTIALAPDTMYVSQGFVRFNAAGTRAESLWVYERRLRSEGKSWVVRDNGQIRMGVPVPFQPQTVYAVDPTGTFVTGWAGEYLLRVTSNGKDTTMLFGRPYTPIPLKPADKSAAVASTVELMRRGNSEIPEAVFRNSFDVAMIPNARPAFDALYIDGAGRRWVRLSTPDTSFVHFDLFGKDGRWLDEVRVTASQWPREPWRRVAMSSSHVAVAVEGEDGRPRVLIYRITRANNGKGM